MAGRPPKHEEERKGNVLRIRLTASEREQLEKAAKEKGMETSTWARQLLLEMTKNI